MHRRLYRILPYLAAAALLAVSTAACGGPAEDGPKETTPSGDYTVIRVLYPGDRSERMKDFLANEFKDRLRQDLNLGVEVSWSPWDQYWNKKDMMIAADEEIDWFWDGTPNLAKVLASKSCIPIDDLIAEYGQNIRRVIPAENFKSYTVNGRLMGIPIQYAPTSEKFRSIIVRQDILKSIGMSEIRSVADMDKFGELLEARFPDMKYIGYDPSMALTRELEPANITYDANNYIVVDENTRKAFFYALTDGWKAAVRKAFEWNQKGWIPEEVTLKPKDQVNREKSGLYAESEGAVSRPFENISDLRKNVPGAFTEEFLLSPDKPKYRTMASTEGIFISPTAKHPEKAVQMIDWMLKSKENYLFCIYGVESKDYIMRDGRIKLLNRDSLWYEWMFRNLNYMEFTDNVSDEFIASFKNWDKDARLSCHFGFAFDPGPVRSEEARLNQIVAEKLIPIATGYIDYDTGFAAAKAALEAAGVEKYVAEYQRQLDTFIKNAK